MERVSFKTAKVLKEAGYPQYGHCEKYYDSCGKIVDKMCDMRKLVFQCPTYLEVWLWLWREKKITIDVVALAGGSYGAFILKFGERLNSQIKFDDPEEAIIAAIEHLVENDLIK